MTPLNVRQWAYCLKHNNDYKEYCNARIDCNADTCQQLEKKIVGLADLYRDWGPLEQIEMDADFTVFNTWLKNKWHLFFVPTRSTHMVTDASSYRHSPGMVLMNIRMHDEMHKTIKEVTQMIDHIYQFRYDYDFSGFKSELEGETIELMTRPIPKPKYGLISEMNAATDGRLKKAIYIHRFKALSHTDTVIAILQDPDNPFGEGWVLNAADRTSLADGTLKRALHGNSEVTMVKRAKKDFASLSRNAMQGRFPDFD